MKLQSVANLVMFSERYEKSTLVCFSLSLKTFFVRNIFQVHFGVNSGASRFALENQAVNEATFRCPDELGWKPQVALLSDCKPFVCSAYERSCCCISFYQLRCPHAESAYCAI